MNQKYTSKGKISRYYFLNKFSAEKEYDEYMKSVIKYQKGGEIQGLSGDTN